MAIVCEEKERQPESVGLPVEDDVADEDEQSVGMHGEEENEPRDLDVLPGDEEYPPVE